MILSSLVSVGMGDFTFGFVSTKCSLKKPLEHSEMAKPKIQFHRSSTVSALAKSWRTHRIMIMITKHVFILILLVLVVEFLFHI